MAIPTPGTLSRLNFLASITLSSTSSWTVQKLTTSLDDQLSTDALVLVGRAISTDTNSASIQLQESVAGSVITTGYAYAVGGAVYSSGTFASIANSAADTKIILAPVIATAAAASTTSFIIYIWSPFDATSTKNYTWTGTTALTSTTGESFIGGATCTNTGAIDGVKILLSAGTMLTGQLSLYQLVGQ